MELNYDTGESAPRDPKLAGAQHNESKVCQPPPGTTRPAAQPAPVWDNVDSDVALRRGIGYLHARDDFQSESLPATSCELVDRQASDPSPRATVTRGFWSDDDLDKTVEATRPDMESGRLDRSDSQRPSAQFLPADAVISTEMRLTTRDLYPKPTAGPYPPDSHCQIGLLEGGSAIAIAQVRGALIDVDDAATDRLYNFDERNAYERNDVGSVGFDGTRTVTRNDDVSTRDQRQHEARNAADDVTAMPHRHAEKRERDRHDGYAPGYLIDERDERRCSDQMMHAYRQSDWTGYAQQSAICSGVEAIAASDACAADAEQRADDVVDYAQRTGQPPRPASGQSQRYDGHPLRRSTSTERQRWMSYVAEEVPLSQRHDCDRLEPCLADLSLRPSEQNLTFRENVMATATQTESTEPCYLRKVVKRLDFMTSDRAKSRPTAKASYACTPAMHRPTINVKQRKSTPNIDVRTAYNAPSKCKASGDNYGDITNTCHYAHRNVDCVDERELRSQSANGMSVCYEEKAMERADHRPINSVARLATPTACSGTSAGRHLSRDDSILAARRMQVNGK